MSTTLDYESIEIYLGDRLRRNDNLDIHGDNFFPVSLLDKLFHYSESKRGTEHDSHGRPVHRNFHGHDFDRWVDNLVARTRLSLADEDGSRATVDLVDIDAFTFDDRGYITVTLPDETSYTLMGSDGHPLIAGSIDNLAVMLDISTMFNRPPVDSDSEPYLGFGTIAHIVRVVCERSGIDSSTVEPHQFTDRLFEHFKREMLPLIPSLWNDMEHIMHYAHPVLTNR
ncbi:MAG: hypothetical protein K2G21_08000 [Muribaculaceae bacterium]|nr:hypothetical protein [Muribaculaceae bacterium]